MPKQFLIYAAILLAGLVAFAWLMPRSADASGYTPTAGIVDATDADFCFGPGNQGVGFACNSLCFAVQDPSYLGLPINCPGPAATITFASSPTNVSCGSMSILTVTVGDSKNLAVADDTVVTFTADVGTVSGASATAAGLASTSLLVYPKASGVVHVVATIGSIRAEKSISINC